MTGPAERGGRRIRCEAPCNAPGRRQSASRGRSRRRATAGHGAPPPVRADEGHPPPAAVSAWSRATGRPCVGNARTVGAATSSSGHARGVARRDSVALAARPTPEAHPAVSLTLPGCSQGARYAPRSSVRCPAVAGAPAGLRRRTCERGRRSAPSRTGRGASAMWDHGPGRRPMAARPGGAWGAQPSTTRVPVMFGWSEQSKKYSPASRAPMS